MSKKEKVKKFWDEHKNEIKVYAIAIGSVVTLVGCGVIVGREFERHKIISSTTAKIGLDLNKASKNVLVAGDIENGIGKLSDISSIVAKGLEEGVPEGHLDDTVIGYMVYVKDKIKS